jgi:hypothetical protein
MVTSAGLERRGLLFKLGAVALGGCGALFCAAAGTAAVAVSKNIAPKVWDGFNIVCSSFLMLIRSHYRFCLVILADLSLTENLNGQPMSLLASSDCGCHPLNHFKLLLNLY